MTLPEPGAKLQTNIGVPSGILAGNDAAPDSRPGSPWSKGHHLAAGLVIEAGNLRDQLFPLTLGQCRVSDKLRDLREDIGQGIL
jgi:hypothetical protein